MSTPPTAPAAHLVTIQPAEGGALVGHLTCDAPPSFVPNMPGVDYVLAIDVAQAVIGHRCVSERLPDDPDAWTKSTL